MFNLQKMLIVMCTMVMFGGVMFANDPGSRAKETLASEFDTITIENYTNWDFSLGKNGFKWNKGSVTDDNPADMLKAYQRKSLTIPNDFKGTYIISLNGTNGGNLRGSDDIKIHEKYIEYWTGTVTRPWPLSDTRHWFNLCFHDGEGWRAWYVLDEDGINGLKEAILVPHIIPRRDDGAKGEIMIGIYHK